MKRAVNCQRTAQGQQYHSGDGNSASSTRGFFRQDGGPQQYRYYLGTDEIPGALTLDFLRFLFSMALATILRF